MRIAFVALALVATGCSGSGSNATDARKPYGTEDVLWLKRLDKWERQYYESSQDVQPAWSDLFSGGSDLARLRDALRPYRECAQSFRTDVGRPEHQRLRRAYDVLLDYCQEERTYALELVKSFATNQNPGLPQTVSTVRSEEFSQRAHRIIEAGLRVNRPLPARGGSSTASRIEPRLSRAAGRLADKRVQVRCWSTLEWQRTVKEWEAYTGYKSDLVGFASGSSRANLAPSYCATLVRYLYGSRQPASGDLEDLADAVALLAHETQHLLNSAADEAETECHAVQSVQRLARFLGASPSYAARLKTTYWTQLYPYDDDEYRSSECRNDGAYDERPETDVFP